ncbi:hypothetical protein GGQ19_003125 [Salinibacter ruber]|uniref:hypothetical protein n=1 Tax=Salinibacter ruber TaxID=146919 RepID=UPI00216A356A|nr:hypothetical protein [Salinibacter ruber]MCS3699024.1 hypothetical protein [Salinibacter ruber]MCS3751928.1 hypothetical protein [Salinibacter ruber]MCS3753604.1 hypothetical protein [Salinibacter ruber]
MTIQPASPDDFKIVRALLQRGDLPHDDLPKTLGPARPVRRSECCGMPIVGFVST